MFSIMKNNNRIRWVLFIPASLSTVVCAAIVCLWMIGKFFSDWCFWGRDGYGVCILPTWLMPTVVSFWSGVAAFSMVYVGVLIAPDYKERAAWSLYVLASLLAFLLFSLWVIISRAEPEFSGGNDCIIYPIVAAVTGLVAVLLVRYRKQPSDPDFDSSV